MKNTMYAVYGACGFGREVMPLVREQLLKNGYQTDIIVFVDDNRMAANMNGHQILTYGEFLACEADKRCVAIAIADSAIRQKLAEKLMVDGVELYQVKANNVVVMDQVEMSEGGILCPFVTLTSNITIGKCFHANIYSYVAHDCQIGNYVTFAPSVKCNGNVVIEDHAYIGTGAIIRQGKPGQPLVIGKHAIVGMGAVVTKDVPAGTTVIGNPARPLIKS
jgi:sugar O-acyltransferase (sialic acid O-acetyltransferase NeuD family)